ncbi:hypothetical protein ScPMuIL_013083 [Solemya velum]
MLVLAAVVLVLNAMMANAMSNCQKFYGEDWVCLDAGVAGRGCYYFGTEDMTFGQAVLDCESRGAIPAVINTPEENQVLYDYMQNISGGHRWLGLQVHASIQNFSWVDAPDVVPSWFHWATGEPDWTHQGEACTQIYDDNGYWNDVPCEKTIRHICEKKFTCADMTGWDDWITLNTTISDSCYYFCTKNHNYTRANHKCTKRGGRMVSIETAEENQMILDFVINKGKNRWMGMTIDHDLDPPAYYWNHAPLSAENIIELTWKPTKNTNSKTFFKRLTASSQNCQ